MDKIKQWLYYIIIGVISFISLVFLPMIGSEIGLGWNIPNSTAGWVVWVGTKIIISAINILIFHSFMQQAKINIRDNENYKKARDILVHQKVKNVVPRSPAKWNTKQYLTKGVSIFLITGLSTIALTQAILTFDWVSMLTYLFTIIMGLIFGILQMKSAEEYWTDEYYRYALLVQENNSSVTDNRQKTNITTGVDKTIYDEEMLQYNEENIGESDDNNKQSAI